jgi:hydrogenase/urease accessory protein HupE
MAVYVLCAATCLGCTVLLIRAYARSRTALLLWSALGFVGLSINNLLLVLDLVFLPDVDLLIARQLAALSAVAVLLYGFIWKVD